MNQADDIRLKASTRVRSGDEDAYPGRLGLLLTDSECGCMIAITAAQIARSASPLKVGGVSVAQLSANRQSRHERSTVRTVASMLASTVIESHLKISEFQFARIDGVEISTPEIELYPSHHLGSKVLIQTGEVTPRIGRLVSTSAQFKMPAPDTSEMTIFTNALEIEALADAPLTRKGDAGAVVTTLTGRAMGIIVCGIETTSFAAPLADMVDHLKAVEAPSNEFIRSYNSQIDESVISEEKRHAASRPPQRPHEALTADIQRALKKDDLDALRERADEVARDLLG